MWLAKRLPPSREPPPTLTLSFVSHVIDDTSPHAAMPRVAAHRGDSPAGRDAGASGSITAASLGSAGFKRDYGIRLAYVAGGMFKRIASTELVSAMGRAGLIGYVGTGGLELDDIESSIADIQQRLVRGESYGMNLVCNLERPQLENRTVDLYLRSGVRYVEAAAFLQITRSLVLYRLKGLTRTPDGQIRAPNRILAKVSRPEVAAAFMRPAPEPLVRQLVASGDLDVGEAELGGRIPVSEDICVEADSAGHTDQGVAYTLMPAMLALRAEIMTQHGYVTPIRIGAAGGIGTPEAVAAAFIMGADFVLTGSINQCTVEAGTSDAVKDMLEDMNVQDTAYAPAGDMFELGAKVQVLKKGLFFPTRANKLFELYKRYNGLDEIDEKTRKQIEERYFERSFDDVWKETKAYYLQANPQKIAACERDPKQKMALVFRWYFVHTTRLAREGSERQRVDYQVHCGPALGAFNQWVKGTELERWRTRHVADIADRLMTATAAVLNARFREMQG